MGSTPLRAEKCVTPKRTVVCLLKSTGANTVARSAANQTVGRTDQATGRAIRQFAVAAIDPRDCAGASRRGLRVSPIRGRGEGIAVGLKLDHGTHTVPKYAANSAVCGPNRTACVAIGQGAGSPVHPGDCTHVARPLAAPHQHVPVTQLRQGSRCTIPIPIPVAADVVVST